MGLSQEELAGRLFTSKSHISEMETGKKNPSGPLLDRMAQVFGVSVPDLYADRSATEKALLEVFRRIPESRHQELIRMLEIAAIPPGKEAE